MKKQERKYVIFILILTVAAVIIKLAEPPEIDWSEGYSSYEKKPFGAYILYSAAGSLFGSGRLQKTEAPVFELQADTSTGGQNLIFINTDFSPDRFEVQILKEYTQKGGTVFIAAHDISGPLADSLGITMTRSVPFIDPQIRSLDSLTQVSVNFSNPELSAGNGWSFPAQLTDSYIAAFDTARTIILGKRGRNEINFIKIENGAGAFLIHTNPILFTNYFTRDTRSYDYAFKALSYLPARDTYWDEYYKTGRAAFSSPMRFIVSDKNLKRAWFLSLTALLLFLIFKGRRTQRIIPKTEPVKNTSIEFAETIGDLYLSSGSHKELLEKKHRFLLEYIRSRLHINAHVSEDSTLTDISRRSGIPKKEVTALFSSLEQLSTKPRITDRELKTITEQIDQFYKKSLR